jgi:hypothetical protein
MKKLNWVIVAAFITLVGCVEDGSEKGDVGAMGDAGPQGPAGEDGEDGQDGVDGEDGQDGVDGEDGQDGVDGEDGQDGVDGTNGSNVIVICGDGICEDVEEGICEADCGDAPPAPFCGDNSCNGNETKVSCPSDCGYCGNGVCDNGETCDTCPADCPEPPSAPFCGDDVCNGSETPSTCSDDCGTCDNGTCDNGEDHLLCPDDCDAPAPTPTFTDGPFKTYRETLSDGSHLCSIGVHPRYASGAPNNQIVGEGATFLQNWDSGSSSQIMSYQGQGIESDGYVRFELPRDSVGVSTSTIRFSYRGWNPQSSKYEYAQYGDAATQLSRMSDASLAMIYCFQYDPSQSTYGCSGKLEYRIFRDSYGRMDCSLTPRGNAQIAND